jgi:hypothetical protein
VLEPVFGGVELLLAIPEHKVPLPGGSTASQNDVWALLSCAQGLISMAVEGKVEESFDVSVREWKRDASRGRKNRLEYLTSLLGLDDRDLDPVRYQFLHRTASAIIEAQRFGARHAVMLVHSFSEQQTGFEDYAAFAELLRLKAEPGRLHTVATREEPRCHIGWVQGVLRQNSQPIRTHVKRTHEGRSSS